MLMSADAELNVSSTHWPMNFVPSGIDFVEAAESHAQWRRRLQNHIDAKATEYWSPSLASLDDCCGMGRWLQGIGRVKFGHYSAFRRLEKDHSEFHRMAGIVLSKVYQGDALGAEAILKNEYAQATRRLMIAINEMSDTMQKNA